MTAHHPVARGRPRLGDRDAISAIGLKLISEQGWSTTTMTQIAAVCELSSPTLFRYFPTKADLFWHGMQKNAAAFTAALSKRKTGEPWLDHLFDSYLLMLHTSGQLPLIKARMRVVATDSDATGATSAMYDQWRGFVLAYVSAALPSDTDGSIPRVVGAMIWASIWAAITSWSTSIDDEPDAYIATARRMAAGLPAAALN